MVTQNITIKYIINNNNNNNNNNNKRKKRNPHNVETVLQSIIRLGVVL